MLNKKALAGTAGAPKVYVEDVFSTHLYTGTGSSQTITNNIDLSGKGGLVWQKTRNQAFNHALYDTARGTSGGFGLGLISNSTSAQVTGSGNYLTTFNSNGFTASANGSTSGDNWVSWTFRKAEKFFDVVTFTGPTTGNTITVNHNLGSVPGMIIYRSYANSDNWYVWHRSLTPNYYLQLESTAAQSDGAHNYNVTSTSFSLRAGFNIAANGGNCIAYLFAHDAGGFGDAGDQNVISCGSLTTNSSGFGSVNLGWEPQWVLIKESDGIFDWNLFDSMRGMSGVPYNTASDAFIEPNTSDAESAGSRIGVSATGFEISLNNSKNYIYIAIRRGPMKTPETGTSVFNPVVYTGTAVDNRLIDTTIAPDMAMIRRRDSSGIDGMYVGTRLLGNQYLLTGTTDAAASDADSFMTPTSGVGNAFSAMNGVGVGVDATRQFNANTTSNNHVIHAFKRSPGFFDVVCYTGTGANRTISHNLGVVPELMIVKQRNTIKSWVVYNASEGNTKYMYLNTTDASATASTIWNNTSPTSTVFSVGTDGEVNGSGSTYVAYLFASLTGVSKVGSYTGNGSTTGPTVTTGFSPRYLLIKSTSTSGEWVVYDTARGLGSGNEPTILLATAGAEYSANYISPSSTGFQLVSNAGDINTNNQTYLYLAIA